MFYDLRRCLHENWIEQSRSFTCTAVHIDFSSNQPSPFLPLLVLNQETGKLRERTGFIMFQMPALFAKAAVVEVAEVMWISFVIGSPTGMIIDSFLLQIGISPARKMGAFPQVSEYFPDRCGSNPHVLFPGFILTSHVAVCLSEPHLKARFLASHLLNHNLLCYLPPTLLNVTFGNITQCSYPQ